MNLVAELWRRALATQPLPSAWGSAALAVVALLVVALLTKPFAVSLPLVMLALYFFPLRRHV